MATSGKGLPASVQAGGSVEISGLVKRYGTTLAVAGVSFAIPPGSFFSLLGPSGCGKSTLLRMIAGLEEPSEGSILIDDIDVTRLSPQARPTAMVFQSYALFPSMSVRENVEYGLKVRRLPVADRAQRVAKALSRVGLEDLPDRSVTALSGGQQQRVALARALVVEPRVMLFDEPLSNLDVALRERTRTELRGLQQSLGTTSVYVTHDQEEALAISDLIGVMRKGRLVQVGRPEELYARPQTAYVARFLGGSNLVRDPEVVRELAPEAARDGRTNGDVLSVRPEDLVFDPEGRLQGRLVSRQFLGSQIEWIVESGRDVLRVRTPASITLSETPRLNALAARWVQDDDSDSTND